MHRFRKEISKILKKQPITGRLTLKKFPVRHTQLCLTWARSDMLGTVPGMDEGHSLLYLYGGINASLLTHPSIHPSTHRQNSTFDPFYAPPERWQKAVSKGFIHHTWGCPTVETWRAIVQWVFYRTCSRRSHTCSQVNDTGFLHYKLHHQLTFFVFLLAIEQLNFLNESDVGCFCDVECENWN